MRLPRRPQIVVASFAGLLLCDLPFLRGENASSASSLHQWTVIETARDNGHRLTNLTPPAVFAPAAKASADLVCRPETRYQSIEGFGGALTASTAYVLKQLHDGFARRTHARKELFNAHASHAIAQEIRLGKSAAASAN